MRATGWHGGSATAKDPAGYGIKFTESDRDRHFRPDWDEVTLELDGGPPVAVSLSPSFWRSCSELRSAEIGRWLLDQGAAPWPTGNPPRIAVNVVDGRVFSARVLRQRDLLS